MTRQLHYISFSEGKTVEVYLDCKRAISICISKISYMMRLIISWAHVCEICFQRVF